jgi:hypothetical protein
VWTRTVAAPTYTERVLVGDDTTTFYTNGQRIVRRAQVDLGRGLFEPFTFDPIMVRPMTEFLRLELGGLPTVDGDYVMRPGETKLVTTKLGNFNPTTPCGLISDISSIRIVGLGAAQVLHDPKDGVVDIEASLRFADTPWSSGGPLTAPMEPGRYTFHWELVIPGLEDPFNLTQEFVVQAIEVGVVPETQAEPEGDTASSERRFEVTLDSPPTAPVSVDWTTVDDNATAGSDYVAESGTVTFAPGETSAFIDVEVNGDTIAESDESFLVELTAPAGGLGGGARIVREVAAAAIVNDDAVLPAFDVADVAVTEGNAGTSTLTFTVQAQTPVPAGGAQLRLTSTDGTATAGVDYVAIDTPITLAAGDTTTTVDVTINGDLIDENDETFTVQLTGPTTLTGDTTATGTITDDDTTVIGDPPVPTLPAFNVADVAVTEGNAATSTLTFTVQASTPVPAGGARLRLTSTDGTATAGVDYVAIDTPITLAAGDTTATVDVTINGDLVDENDETLTVRLTGAAALTGRTSATGTITDDDTAVINASSVTVTEGTSGAATDAVIAVILSTPADRDVSLDVATSLAAGTAQAADFVPTSVVVTFPAGSQRQEVIVPVVADSRPELDESVAVLLANPRGATVATPSVNVQIVDDDAWFVSGPSSVGTTEGDLSGPPSTVQVIAELNAPAPAGGLLVDYATVDGTAQAGSDYVARSGTLTFAPGQTTATIEIELINDLTLESTETFTVVFSNIRFAPLAALRQDVVPAESLFGSNATVTVSILDNDVSGTLPATGGDSLPWLHIAVIACLLGVLARLVARGQRSVGTSAQPRA